MEENSTYFDNTAAPQPDAPSEEQPAVPAPVKSPKEERGSGKGVFLAGMVVGLAISLMIVGISYLSITVQKLVAGRQDAGEDTVTFAEGSAIDASVVSKLQTLEAAIDKYYYLGEVTDEELTDGIYKGMLESLGDPYSEYYSAEELLEIMSDTEGVYYGIGAYVSLDTDTGLPKVSGTIAGSPAEAAGLRADDLIYEVDGVSTYGLSLSEAVHDQGSRKHGSDADDHPGE
jgi:carboxyl-terminal processing protease